VYRRKKKLKNSAFRPLGLRFQGFFNVQKKFGDDKAAIFAANPTPPWQGSSKTPPTLPTATARQIMSLVIGWHGRIFNTARIRMTTLALVKSAVSNIRVYKLSKLQFIRTMQLAISKLIVSL
jgi:hypothetical protein